MYDKTVRRRRAVLALLVVLSLLLLTAYFGEAPSGRLHGVQRDFLTVVSPIQDGANKALKPVRDLFGWFGDTLHAKSQRDELRKQIDKLRRELVADQAEKRSYRAAARRSTTSNQLGVADYHPVTATVVGKSPNIWYSTVTIDKGAPRGRARQRPRDQRRRARRQGRRRSASDGAQVDLITDSYDGRLGADRHEHARPASCSRRWANPNDLLLQYLPANTQANKGEYVVTSGTVAGPDDSLYPPGLLIGQVTSVNEESAYKSVNVHPLANLHNLDVVQVLTSAPGHAPANLAALAATPARRPEQRSAAARRRTARLDRGGRMTATPSAGCIAPRRRAVASSSCSSRSASSRRCPCSASTPTSRRCWWPSSGCCAARRSARSTGFAVGLLVDLALLQTLGLTSLVFTLIGYWAGACASCATRRPR